MVMHKDKKTRPIRLNHSQRYFETQKGNAQITTCLIKVCHFATQTLRWWGVNGHISSDSNTPHNDSVGNVIMSIVTSAQRNNVIGRQ